MRRFAIIVLLLLFCATAWRVTAQPRIAHWQPDALAPGMTIALEILAPESDVGAFGHDGIAPNDVRVVLERASDSDRVVFGPHIVSWDGRLIQVPVMVPSSSQTGFVDFHIERGIEKSDKLRLDIRQPGPPIVINGTGQLGDGGSGGSLTNGNTMVVESIELSSTNPFDVFSFYRWDQNGNIWPMRLQPMTILSRGPIRIRNTTLTLTADSINGGSGGGGGGAGFSGTGGYGYTGGGSDTDFVEPALNIGTGCCPNAQSGGPSKTGVRGGKSDNSDQGGGGGTGNPFGSSGLNGGQNSPSFEGGFGGGSGGGENTGAVYGGGGGGFGSRGERSMGEGDNGGHLNGGRFLVPMMGGSGGGAGNSIHPEDSSETAGSGGGGGGAVTILSYQTIELTNAHITADGGRGSSGITPLEAGGGGGSGGGLLLGARSNVSIENTIFSVNGGEGGTGGNLDPTAHGGKGGFGRVRFDGFAGGNCDSCTISFGPTLSLPSTQLTTRMIKLSGFAGAGNDLTDSIRIYYRSRHTVWQKVDTVREKNGSTWKKFIDTPPDSLLFVCVFAQVNTPSRSFAHYEPDWLLSHLSSGIISVRPRSELVVSPDLLNIGCTKKQSCLEGLVYLENRGEAPLSIDTIYTTDDQFTVISYPSSLSGYDPKTVTIRYCPQQIQSDTAQLVIVADSVYRRTILTGCGLDKDRQITILDGLNFEPLHVDSCKELTFRVRSTGADTALIDLRVFDIPPFRIIEPSDTIVALPKGTILPIRVRFCPTDTGSFSSTFFLTERRDSIVARGLGFRKLLFAPDTLWLGEHCIHSCIDTGFRIYSIGNALVELEVLDVDTTIISMRHPLNKQQISGGASDSARFTICFDSLGDRYSTIIYHSDADLSITTVLHYRGVGIALAKDDLFDLGAICIGTCDSLSASIKNASSAFTIASAKLAKDKDSVISVSGLPSLPLTVGENDSLVIKLRACPPTSGEFFDTLIVEIEQGECDSTIFIPVHAIGSNATLVPSSGEIVFSAVDSGSCVSDTILVENPCEAEITATLTAPVGMFERIAPSSPITIAGGGSVALIYQFCPTDSLLHTAQDTILYNGSKLLLNLSGKGKIKEDIPLPFVRFTLDHLMDAVVRQEFTYRIALDSIYRSSDMTDISAELRFDPIVALPLRIESEHSAWSVTGTESQPGIFRFTANRLAAVTEGSFAAITFQALRSRRDSTAVNLENLRILPQGLGESDTGSIKTNACAEPPGNLIIPGEYGLGDPVPNPMHASVNIPIKLGADGTLLIRLYNAQGAVVFSKSEQKAKGEQQFVLDAAAIPAGFYVLEAESWGWREHKSVLIVK